MRARYRKYQKEIKESIDRKGNPLKVERNYYKFIILIGISLYSYLLPLDLFHSR